MCVCVAGVGRQQGALMKLLCWYTVGVPVWTVLCSVTALSLSLPSSNADFLALKLYIDKT